jgi:hypothetical protein
MKYVLVTVSGGIIDEVKFYDEQLMAIQQLSAYVWAMNPENHDAAVYGPGGMIANAKAFLDENDQYIEHRIEDVANLNESDESMYIIGNPEHRLGFMVASHDDPLGYKEPAAALSDLGQMRQDYGSHLKLYRVEPVNGPVAHTKDLEQYNKDCWVDDFDYCLVNEYLNELS